MAWIVSGTSPAGAMSEHAADEQRALERMYALSDDPRFDAFVFSCHPADVGWRSCDSCDRRVPADEIVHVPASTVHDDASVCADCAGG